MTIIDAQEIGCPLGVFSPHGGRGLGLPAEIPADYTPTPTNATAGGCGCKK